MKRVLGFSPAFAGCCLLLGMTTPSAGQEPAAPSERSPSSADVKVVLSHAERVLLADVRDGRFATQSFGEAALLASGVTDAAQRTAYLQRLDALESQAKAALAGARTPAEKGGKLLEWLYSPSGPIGPVGPGKRMKYVHNQTSLAVLLDTGAYNCVSSAVVYNVIGRRLGLDLRAIEVPDHVFSVLFDGDERMDVETTTPRGFNPLRDKAALKELQDLTGFVYIPARTRTKQREIGEAALVGTIYYNRGVEFNKEGRHREAFHVNICALNLDSGMAAAANNARAALGEWAADAVRSDKIERAVDIIRQNVECLKDPKAETKLLIVAYDSRGRLLSKSKDWPDMAKFYTAAFKRHRDAPEVAKHLENNAVAGYDSWAKPFMKPGSWPEAMKIFEQGVNELGENKDLKQRLRYCEQMRDK